PGDNDGALGLGVFDGLGQGVSVVGIAGVVEYGVGVGGHAQVDHRGAMIGRPVDAPDQRIAVGVQSSGRVANRHDLDVGPAGTRLRLGRLDTLDDEICNRGAVTVLQARVLNHSVAIPRSGFLVVGVIGGGKIIIGRVRGTGEVHARIDERDQG